MKSLSNQALHDRLTTLSADDRRITLDILHHLREAERRFLYAERGHSSLFEYVVTELQYSESAAQRRISAMRVMRDLPELEEKVESGKLKVTQLSQVQSFLRSEKKEGKTYSKDQRRTLILETVGRSTRETEKLLAEKSPSFAVREKVRVITPTLTEIRFSADEVLMQDLERVRNRFAHQLPASSGVADVLRFLAAKILKEDERKRGSSERGRKETPKEKKSDRMESPNPLESDRTGQSTTSDRSNRQVQVIETRGLNSKCARRRSKDQSNVTDSVQLMLTSPEDSLPAPKVKTPSRYIPLPVKRAVWTRDEGRCTYRSPATGKQCTSTHRLEIDHKIPFALGGSSKDAVSLRLLCWAHNQVEARRIFGSSAHVRFRKN